MPALREAGDFDRAARAALSLAPRWVAQARLRTLGSWLASFPAAWRGREPDLEHGTGRVWMMTKPGGAREHLLHAAAGYAARGDAAGRLRSLAQPACQRFLWRAGRMGPAVSQE